MFHAYGLYGHIRANRIRSVLLLAGFVVLLHILLFSVLLLFNGFFGGQLSLEQIVLRTWDQFGRTYPVALVLALGWFAIAYSIHHTLIAGATGARPVTRVEAPALYNALENLCISRGIPMPHLHMIDTDALNAYAAGLREGDYVVAVTRGLVEKLSPAELEAVLAHELTHIRNKDAQMMVVAVIFAGVFGFFGDLFVRGWDFPYGTSPRGRRNGGYGYDNSRDDDRSSSSSSGGSSSGGRGNGGAVVAIIIAIAVILISWGVSTLIRFALSRSREFLADAGAVELTKNPDAMIGALRKIEENAVFEVPSRMEAFFIESPVKNRLTGLMDTHPAIADRISALERFAGGAAPLRAFDRA